MLYSSLNRDFNNLLTLSIFKVITTYLYIIELLKKVNLNEKIH